MTTYYFIRHAEKKFDGTFNPNLTAKGYKRAKFWAEYFKDKNIDLVYCTTLRRTHQTAEALLEKLNINFKYYDSAALYDSIFQEETKGKTVLIVGHRDSTPAFVNRIIKERRYTYIKSNNFSNVYKVEIDNSKNLTHELKTVDF